MKKVPGFRLLKKPLKGQGLVEFAIVLPIFLVLMLGIIEFGWFFFIYSTANQAAREAARYGAGAGELGPQQYYYQHCSGIREVATRIGRYANVEDTGVTIWYDDGPGTSQTGTCPVGTDFTTHAISLGERVVVQVNVTYNPIIPLLNIPSIDIKAVSARTIVARVQISRLVGTNSVY